MKKNLLLLALALLAGPGFGQNLDSLKVAREVDSLIQVSRTITGQGDFDQALEINAFAEKIALEKLGRESAAYGNCRFNHGRVLGIKGAKLEAVKCFLDAKSIQEKTFGKEHPDYVRSVYNLAILNEKLGRYVEAEPYYLEVKVFREKTLGKNHPDYAKILYGIGWLYYEMGRYKDAEVVSLEAMEIQEKVLGKDNADYASSANNLGLVYQSMGQYEKTEPLFMQVVSIREKLLGKMHPDYCGSLINLGRLYTVMGRYNQAELLFLEAKQIFEHIPNFEQHQFYIYCLLNLSSLYEYMGQYEKVEPLCFQSLSIVGKSLGQEHPDYAITLGSLGNIYRIMGQFEKSEQVLLQARAIFEKPHNKENSRFVNVLNILGALYVNTGQYEKAELIFLEIKAINESNSGKEYFDFVNQFDLGLVYYHLGQYSKAERMYIEGIEYITKNQGENASYYAKEITNLALIYERIGNLEKADSLFTQAKSIYEANGISSEESYLNTLRGLGLVKMKTQKLSEAEDLALTARTRREKSIGVENQPYLSDLDLLFAVYYASGKTEEAALQLLQAAELEKKLLLRASTHFSQQEIFDYLPRIAKTENWFGTLAQLKTKLPTAFNQSYFDACLFHKGYFLQASQQMNQLVAVADDSTRQVFFAWKGYQRRLAEAYSQPKAERKGVDELEASANDLEKMLAQRMAGFASLRKDVHCQEVQAKLKPGEAALEFVHYRFYNPTRLTDSTIYAALLLRPGDTTPQFIPLFEKNELKDLMRGASGGSNFLKINALYSQKSLYDLIWKPLEPMLAGIKTVYCAPSGLLHRLNLAAIPTPEGKVYGERRQLVVMGSTRSLAVGTKASQLAVGNGSQTSSNDAYLAGGIRYDSDSTVIAYANRGATSRSIERNPLAFQPDSLSITRGGVLDYLPATAAEVQEIGQTLRYVSIETKVDTGFYATEESFRQLGVGKPSPRIIHLATHGYFFPDPAVSKKHLAIGSEPVFKMSEHPMIRSGLIMAGAKQAWLTGKHPEGLEDGILTAYEISQMNLSGTELVVLSACETGLGDIVGNEGVYGLQRAFKIAGAKYLIMSLWKVDDRSTQAFMTSFYRHWLTEKQTVPQAFRSTQLEMRAKYSGAYDWAGFVLIE
jgi:CHAT domain-containing protein/tetratricopeptide (TPR) repeat protein